MARRRIFPVSMSDREKEKLQHVADELHRSKAATLRALVRTAHRVLKEEREEANDA